jgi:hypothetical protein
MNMNTAAQASTRRLTAAQEASSPTWNRATSRKRSEPLTPLRVRLTVRERAALTDAQVRMAQRNGGRVPSLSMVVAAVIAGSLLLIP